MRDDIPAPGIPLTEDIHQVNQTLIDDDLQKRLAMVASRLTKWQIMRLQQRQQQLRRLLIRGGYNDLVSRRWELFQRLEQYRYEITRAPGRLKPLIAAQARTAIGQGNEINVLLAPLLPVAAEYEQGKNRLDAHAEYVRWQVEDRENTAAFRREAIVWLEQLRSVFRQSERLRYKFDDKNGKTIVRVPKIERILFKDDRVYYKIQTSAQTFSERLFGRWHSALPDDVDVSDLTSDVTLENLSAACNRVVDVVRSQRGTSLFYAISRLDSPDGIPSRVMFANCIEFYPVQDHSKTPWMAGVGDNRKVSFYNFDDQPHMLLAGSTRSGKSNHVNQMIATLVTMNQPDELRLILVDLKGGIEFTHWQGLQHSLGAMVTSASAVLEKLQYARSIMERRLVRFEAIKAKKLSSYNSKSKNRLPRIVIFIDEMATLLGLGELTTSIQTELRVLSSQGAAVGIHLVLCTQHSSVDVLPGWIKTNMVLRVSGRMPSISASQVVLDSIAAARLPNIPGRLIFAVGNYELIAQSPLVSDAEIAMAVSTSRAFPAPDESEFDNTDPVEVVVDVVKPAADRETVLRYALEHMEGNLKARPIYMAMREIYRVTERPLIDMFAEIGREEFVDVDGMSYRAVKQVGNYYRLVTQLRTSEVACLSA